MIIMNVSHVVRAAVVTVLGTVLPTTMTACGGSSGGGDGRPNVVVDTYPFEFIPILFDSSFNASCTFSDIDGRAHV